MLSLNAFSSFRLAAIPLVSILFSSGILPAQALEVGEQFCVEGFVMDFYCINRGTLLDNQSVRTLVGPDLHSVHCLVDVERCVATDYEILLDPLPGETLYARGWRLDDATKGRVIELARSIGSCRTCDTPGGLVQGMRAALNATVLDLGSSSVPPRISATEIQVSELGVPFCADTTSEFVPRAPPNRITSAGTDLQKKYYAHASCMLIGFGWLLPTGAIFARLFKHRPNGLWFKIHLPLQIIGLIFAISGWAIALKNFDVFVDKGYNSYKHGVFGMTTMSLGLLQPLNAIFRPHFDPESAKTTLRSVWEYFHKGTGYAALVLAVVTIGYGTVSLPDPDDQKTFQLAYGIGVGGILLLLCIILQFDRITYKGVAQGKKETTQTDAEEHDSMLEEQSP